MGQVRITQDKEDAKSLNRRSKRAQKPVYYEPGDRVYLWEDVTDLRPDANGMRKVTSKLSYKWSGPHKVLTTVRNNCCKIQHHDKRFKESIKIMNVNRLARCHKWDDRIERTDAEEEEQTNGLPRVHCEPSGGELMAFKYGGDTNTPFDNSNSESTDFNPISESKDSTPSPKGRISIRAQNRRIQEFNFRFEWTVCNPKSESKDSTTRPVRQS
jgi:hypothetical protein